MSSTEVENGPILGKIAADGVSNTKVLSTLRRVLPTVLFVKLTFTTFTERTVCNTRRKADTDCGSATTGFGTVRHTSVNPIGTVVIFV